MVKDAKKMKKSDYSGWAGTGAGAVEDVIEDKKINPQELVEISIEDLLNSFPCSPKKKLVMERFLKGEAEAGLKAGGSGNKTYHVFAFNFGKDGIDRAYVPEENIKIAYIKKGGFIDKSIKEFKENVKRGYT